MFANAALGRSNPILTATVDPKDTNVVMRSDQPQLAGKREPDKSTNVIVVTQVVTKTNMVYQAKDQDFPQPASGKAVVGAFWWPGPGVSRELDFDIYVRVPRDRVELSYKNTNSSRGRFFRDIRHAQGLTSGDWRASWETVELDGDDLPPEIWINLYSGRGPARGEVRVLRRGREHWIAFTFPDVRGNGGIDVHRRERSEHWLRIDLIFPRKRGLD